MGRKHSVIIGSFVILLLIALAFTLGPLRPGDDASESRAEQGAGPRVVASLPAVNEGARAKQESERVVAETAPAPAGPMRAGRVRVLDGGPIPAGTRAVVRLDIPNCLADTSLNELMRMGFGRMMKAQRAVARNARLNIRTAASAEVSADGAFTIESPAQGAFYLELDSSALYTT